MWHSGTDMRPKSKQTAADVANGRIYFEPLCEQTASGGLQVERDEARAPTHNQTHC